MGPIDAVTTARIVSGLRRPEAYPERPASVTAIETHMSWVFLAGADAYKLKKAIRQDGLDFSTPEKRRRNCLEEVRLNRRLAAGVYYGVAAVSLETDGSIVIDGRGPASDWLVHMRRLPEDRSLDAVLRAGAANREAPWIRCAARHLATFYAAAAPDSRSAAEHRAWLTDGVRRDLETLLQPRYGLPRSRVEALAHRALLVLEHRAGAFDARVDAGRLVEGHGDLRPEHIWLVDPPAIIDCVEFDRALRIVDPADELAFLALECERLGAPVVGRWFIDAYAEVTGDEPPEWLLGFYRVYRALRRATIAARHLDDPAVADPGRFLARARDYVGMAEPIIQPCPQG